MKPFVAIGGVLDYLFAKSLISIMMNKIKYTI